MWPQLLTILINLFLCIGVSYGWVFSGARARFVIDGTTVGYCAGVSGEEAVDYEPINTLHFLEVREHVPVSYRCSMSAAFFRLLVRLWKRIRVKTVTREILRSSLSLKTFSHQVRCLVLSKIRPIKLLLCLKKYVHRVKHLMCLTEV